MCQTLTMSSGISYSDLTIIVTHFRTPIILNECLERIMRFLPNARVIVVDSGHDGSLERLNQTQPSLQTLSVNNHSMANTVNAGLKLAKTPYILQMNADVYLEENSVKDMLDVLKRDKVGMVGPICYSKDKKLQNQGLLYYRYYRYLKLSKQKSVRTAWLSGCCNLFKKEALEQVGGLNSSLRFYNEDMEWGWRFNKAAWHCHLVNTALTHLGGSSTPNDPKFLIEGYRGGYKLSQWYKPKFYQLLHKAIVQLELRQKRKQTAHSMHDAYGALSEIFDSGNFDQSPFGETLEVSNPAFKQLTQEH